MLMLKYYEKKILFHDLNVAQANRVQIPPQTRYLGQATSTDCVPMLYLLHVHVVHVRANPNKLNVFV